MADRNPRAFVRAGSTIEPKRRRGEYVYRKEYSGTMYYAETGNMRESEDVLLAHKFPKNVHTISNSEDAPGYVYLI